MLAGLFVRLAAALLPRDLHARYCQEWEAELHVLRDECGWRAGLGFAISLLPAAARTTMEVRSTGETAYAEMSLAALCGLPPVLFLLGYGATQNVWILVVAQTLNFLGIFLVAHGLWHNEGRLLDSLSPRIGLIFIVIGATSGQILIDNLPALAPINPDEVISSVIPNSTIPIGFFLLVVASYFRRFRRRLQLVALVILAPGAAAAVLVAIVNAANNGGISAVVSLIYGLPIVGLAWASYKIAGRSQVFAEEVKLVEL